MAEPVILEMKEVSSTQLKSVGYDPQTSYMYIEFVNGNVYRYADVPILLYQQLVYKEKSVGIFFYEKIRSKFFYSKVLKAKVVNLRLELKQ